MLLAAGRAPSVVEARDRCIAALASGRAEAKFAEMVAAQGGDCEALSLRRLPRAPVIHEITSSATGYLAEVSARVVGDTARALGAGRLRREDRVDHAVGIVLAAKVGDRVAAGEPLALIHARSEESAAEAEATLLRAFTIVDEPPTAPKLIHTVIREP
jgi:thymidine phosphorylase